VHHNTQLHSGYFTALISIAFCYQQFLHSSVMKFYIIL
jgi:hypothetical protein